VNRSHRKAAVGLLTMSQAKADHGDTPLNKFVGIYSGRMPTDQPHEAQIGLVWGDYLIDEIIAGNIRDE
jgi:hypothetical protein